MCAISGIFDTTGKPISQDLLARMNASLAHRGPDGEGTFVDREAGIAHRRLSIIDLGGGAQPMGNEDDSLQVVFNGEIYNYVELREELIKFGHKFKTSSDTEVILHGYEQWGTDCVKRFNGMFAFALWNSTTRQMFIARDHLGIKPLYYTQVGSEFLFASEIKALLLHPRCPRALDVEAMSELFTFRYVPSPKTLFQKIYKLPPGHSLTISRAGVKVERFWKWIPQIRTRYSEDDLVEEYRSLLEDTVRLQLRSDVPLGLFLSSGIDSGVLLAIMSSYSSRPVQTFTIGFTEGVKTNEIEDAAQLARRFGAQHYHQIVSPEDYVRYYDRYMTDIEEPVGHEPAAAFYFVAKLAREHAKVALTGQGADEPWAGYDRYIGVKLSAIYSRMPSFFRDKLAPLAARIPGRMERFKRGLLSLGEPDVLTRFTKVYSFFNAEMKSHLCKGALREIFERDPYAPKQALSRLQADVSHLDPLSQMLYVDARANLPDDLLMIADKTSMANGLEVRVPFLDSRLVEYIESLPPGLKLKGFTGKYLHKRAVTKWLPEDFVYRKKKGFAHPIAHWMRTSMKPLVDDCLLSPSSGIAQYFDQRYIKTILDRDRSGKDNFMRHIYLLLSLELWHRAFLR